MTASDRRARLEAERAHLAALVGTYGDDDILARLGFEQRLEDVTRELAALAETVEADRAETDLTFYGGPVVASEGIDADFASKVIASYQDLVSNTALAVQAKMHITGVIHGSFGFQLRELTDPQATGPTALFGAVETAAKLIDAAGRDDEDFVEAVAGMSPRAQDAVRHFFETVHAAHATFRLSSARRQTEFTRDRVLAAVERVTATHKRETIDDFLGVFMGTLHASRSFEFQLASGEIISGKAHPDIEDLTVFDRLKLRRCIARIATREWLRGQRVYRTYYTLVELLDLPDAPTE